MYTRRGDEGPPRGRRTLTGREASQEDYRKQIISVEILLANSVRTPPRSNVSESNLPVESCPRPATASSRKLSLDVDVDVDDVKVVLEMCNTFGVRVQRNGRVAPLRVTSRRVAAFSIRHRGGR